MPERKYDRYFITDPKPFEEGVKRDPLSTMTPMAYLDNNVIKDAFYMACSWIFKPTTYTPPEHTHDFDEILGFYGTDPDNPKDLCGEIELWMDGEKYLITKSCSVFVPKGLKHCPMLCKKADRPIFHFSTGQAPEYVLTKV